MIRNAVRGIAALVVISALVWYLRPTLRRQRMDRSLWEVW